jgi:hypothetical protein
MVVARQQLHNNGYSSDYMLTSLLAGDCLLINSQDLSSTVDSELPAVTA